jgi:hypothetical protein
MNQPRKRSVRATEEGRQKLIQAKAAGRDDDKALTYERIAEKARVDKKTVERFFRGEAKDRDSVIAIVQALGLDLNEVVDPKEWNPAEQTADAIDWREVCGKVLAQQRENQRLLALWSLSRSRLRILFDSGLPAPRSRNGEKNY